jgi:hypothetical protein
MTEQEEPNREPDATEPAELAPPIAGSMASPTPEAADNRRAAQGGGMADKRRTPKGGVRQMLRSLWSR